MSNRIIICGLNGAGKSTFGKALADSLNYRFIDYEDIFFATRERGYKYAHPYSREEAERILAEKTKEQADYIFVATKGDLSCDYDLAIVVDTPKALRMERIRERSYRKYGDRILPGGDIYEQEEHFFDMARSRPEDYSEKWALELDCPIIHIDGTKDVEYNIKIVQEQLTK